MTWLDNGIINPPATTLDDVETVHAYHIMPRGISKAAAIRTDLERRGLEPADAVMIGDSMSDLETAREVGLVILVANALRSPALAAAAPTFANAVVTQGSAGEGWAEFASAWMAARGM
jgi:hydroxymethylpyrimidine pyrophosphatase-like HAD family hydrolase